RRSPRPSPPATWCNSSILSTGRSARRQVFLRWELRATFFCWGGWKLFRSRHKRKLTADREMPRDSGTLVTCLAFQLDDFLLQPPLQRLFELFFGAAFIKMSDGFARRSQRDMPARKGQLGFLFGNEREHQAFRTGLPVLFGTGV